VRITSRAVTAPKQSSALSADSMTWAARSNSSNSPLEIHCATKSFILV
jgi:hypothetical protein